MSQIQYLFRTYNGNKYVAFFDMDNTIEDAIMYFEKTFLFKDVQIYPIEDHTPKFDVDNTKKLDSFPNRYFLLSARYTRNSKKYEKKSNDIENESYMKTPEPTKFGRQRDSILIIQQASNLLIDNPDFDDIFNEILNIAKMSNTDHFNILNDNKNKQKIKELLKRSKNNNTTTTNNNDDDDDFF